MARLISLATGRRPVTANHCLWALAQTEGTEDLLVVRWEPGPFPSQVYQREIARSHLIGGTKARCQNHALALWQDAHGDESPDVWFTLDDDVICGRGALSACERVLAADPEIGLVGVWNDCSEPLRPDQTETIAGERVQTTRTFDWTVGGPVHAIPRRVLDLGFRYDETNPRHDDWLATREILALGYKVALIVSRYVVVLPDDGTDPDYRAWITETHFANLPA